MSDEIKGILANESLSQDGFGSSSNSVNNDDIDKMVEESGNFDELKDRLNILAAAYPDLQPKISEVLSKEDPSLVDNDTRFNNCI